jgi:hypothetical protein
MKTLGLVLRILFLAAVILMIWWLPLSGPHGATSRLLKGGV